ncbi:MULTISPECIES: hypothetical protein [unclassified Sulfitobacter]|uniref:hypothetical protein n=1 Tax=unclassified Sulfitobacter TaxID=196795 RepID=UPI0004E34C18|nr:MULTISPECIES: hypothetical protein [unclassified Sulfitobacter]ULO20312.1 epimerase [Sulfitobacter sp. CB2047]
MKKCVLIFGATGTVGAGALLECLDHPEIGEVLCIVRRPTGRSHPKLREIIHRDFLDFATIASDMHDIDGCFWAVGTPSSGADEQAYIRVEHDYVAAAARALHKQSPQCCFVFGSGAGADETETSRQLWARVKGQAENAVLGMGFKQALIFRPGTIAPRRGIKHNVPVYGLAAWLAPLMRPFGMATSTEEIGRAFIAAVLGKNAEQPARIRLGSAEINTLAKLA